MELKAKFAIALFLFALIISTGCVNRYEGCDPANMDPLGAGYTCCIKPGEVFPDPLGRPRTCCPGTSASILPPDTQAKCHITLTDYWSSWQYVAILAVLISAFLASIAYLVGALLSNPSLVTWAKNELYQVMASALILGSLIGIVFSVQNGLALAINDLGGPTCLGSGLGGYNANEDCHIVIANAYLEVMYQDSLTMAMGLVRINTVFSVFRSTYVTSELLVSPNYGSILMPFAGLGVPSQTMTNTLDVIMKVMMLIKAQQVALNLITFGLFPVLLVMGLVLRTFFFTRKLGGLLIALAIGMFLVYPLIFILAHNIWLNTIHKADRDTTGISYNKNIGSYILKTNLSENVTWMLYPKLEPGEPSISRILKIRNNMTGFAKSIGQYVDQEFLIGDGGYIEKTSILLVYATLIPFIALMTTIGFVRGLSPVLGGDVEIAGLTKIL